MSVCVCVCDWEGHAREDTSVSRRYGRRPEEEVNEKKILGGEEEELSRAMGSVGGVWWWGKGKREG